MSRMLLALLVGLPLAFALPSGRTQRQCTPAETGGEVPVSQCVTVVKTYVNPANFINNKHNDLVNYSENFAVASIFVFILLSIVSIARKKPSLKLRRSE